MTKKVGPARQVTLLAGPSFLHVNTLARPAWWTRLKWDNREIKIHVYRKRQTSDLSREFRIIENKQIKTVQIDSYG